MPQKLSPVDTKKVQIAFFCPLLDKNAINLSKSSRRLQRIVSQREMTESSSSSFKFEFQEERSTTAVSVGLPDYLPQREEAAPPSAS